MAYLTNGTLNYNLTKDAACCEQQLAYIEDRNKMDPTYPDPNDSRFTDPAPVFTILNNQLYRDGVAIGKIYNNKTGKVVEITETTETGFKYQDTNEDALINKDNSIAVVEKLTGLKGEVVSLPNNIITYEASAKLAETTSNKSSGLHTNAFNTTIKSHTFENGVGTIEFEEDVTSIGNNAFYNCSNLTNVTIPNSVTSIGDGAFQKCTNLTEVTIPNGITIIGNYTFAGCSGLTSIVIPDSVTSIGGYAFWECTSLTNVTIPDSVTNIGIDAFWNCTSLTNVTIPNSVISIVDGTFNSCINLASVIIGSSVTSIGYAAFQSCSALTSITSLATTAPTIQSSTFQNVKTNGTLTVPNGSSGYDVWMGTGDYYLGKYNWTKVEQ